MHSVLFRQGWSKFSQNTQLQRTLNLFSAAITWELKVIQEDGIKRVLPDLIGGCILIMLLLVA